MMGLLLFCLIAAAAAATGKNATYLVTFNEQCPDHGGMIQTPVFTRGVKEFEDAEAALKWINNNKQQQQKEYLNNRDLYTLEMTDIFTSTCWPNRDNLDAKVFRAQPLGTTQKEVRREKRTVKVVTHKEVMEPVYEIVFE